MNAKSWLIDSLKLSGKSAPSELGFKVIEILNTAYAGVEEISKSLLHARTHWDNKFEIMVVLPGPIRSSCPHVFSDMLILALDANLEMECSGRSNWGHLKIVFRDLRMVGGAPKIEQLVKTVRKRHLELNKEK